MVDPEDGVTNSDNTNLLSKTNSVKSVSKDASTKSAPRDGSILDLLTNSTSLHGSHVYDQYCDICTGKVKQPSTPLQISPDSQVEEESMATQTTEVP